MTRLRSAGDTALVVANDGFLNSRRDRLVALTAHAHSRRLCQPRICGSGRAHELWAELDRGLSAGGRLRRTHFERRKSRRPAGSKIRSNSSWRSMPKQPNRSASKFRRRCSRPPARWSNDAAVFNPSAQLRSPLRRREFIPALGCAALASPLAARAQQRGAGDRVFGHCGRNRAGAHDFYEGLKIEGYVRNQTDGCRIPLGGRAITAGCRPCRGFGQSRGVVDRGDRASRGAGGEKRNDDDSDCLCRGARPGRGRTYPQPGQARR